MSEEYDNITAKYYAAYRPSLHAPILSRCIKENEQFSSGLDVGCGTGRSTIALAEYCDTVIGIDPSTEMLYNAIKNPKIKYLNGLLEESNMDTDSFDILTFAGVLFYSKSKKLYDEVIRVSKTGAQIIIYDFEVLLKDTFKILDLSTNALPTTQYDYEINFSGLDDGRLPSKAIVKDKVDLSVSAADLTCLVLSEKLAYEKLKSKYESKNVFKSVQEVLNQKWNSHNLKIETNIFYSVYENRK